jgi:hypothetical protein
MRRASVDYLGVIGNELCLTESSAVFLNVVARPRRCASGPQPLAPHIRQRARGELRLPEHRGILRAIFRYRQARRRSSSNSIVHRIRVAVVSLQTCAVPFLMINGVMDEKAPRTPDQRLPLLIAERNRKMAASAHAYVRGSTARFYEWLEASDRPSLPEGPPVWICGDCHVGNLGPIASASGTIAIQVRDLDQTVIGNPANDIIRLGLSLAMAARSSDLPGITTAHMLECMVEGYEAAFAPEAGDKHDVSNEAMPKTVKLVMQQAAGRSWKHLADERIEGTQPNIPIGKRFWPLTTDERAAVDVLFGRSSQPAPIHPSVSGRDRSVPREGG